MNALPFFAVANCFLLSQTPAHTKVVHWAKAKILYGCVTCPWHGFSYKARNGRSPAPFTEMIPTYNMKLEGGILYIDRKANQPGTDVEPIIYEVANNG